MSFTFRPAVRENVGLLIGLVGASGAGKTYTAMTLAQGMAGSKRFCVIDTEARRALHYADRFAFDHGEMSAPFRPHAYADAIKAADEAGYPVIVVDSFSHEHAGEGGLLDFQEAELQRMAGDDWKKRESCKMAAWIKPKMEHKQMVQRLLQMRAHLILCFRAEQKVEMVRDEKTGKMQIVQKQSLTGTEGWIPICEKTLPYELTASLLLIPDRPGLPHPIKLQEQHRPFFPLDRPISAAAGRSLASWATGSQSSGKSATGDSQPPTTTADRPLTKPERERITVLARENGHDVSVLVDWLKATCGVSTSTELKYRDFERICTRLKDKTALSADLLQPPADEPGAGG